MHVDKAEVFLHGRLVYLLSRKTLGASEQKYSKNLWRCILTQDDRTDDLHHALSALCKGDVSNENKGIIITGMSRDTVQNAIYGMNDTLDA